jgi:hypothetical protein
MPQEDDCAGKLSEAEEFLAWYSDGQRVFILPFVRGIEFLLGFGFKTLKIVAMPKSS